MFGGHGNLAEQRQSEIAVDSATGNGHHEFDFGTTVHGQ